jgi:large subunit ribosomal protein L21
MFAVLRVQGYQFRVEPEDLVQVPRMEAQVGTQLPIGEVLLLGGAEGEVKVGSPVVTGAQVMVEIVRHLRGPKVRGSKYKKRKDYRRRWGHRSDLTEVRIHAIRS